MNIIIEASVFGAEGTGVSRYVSNLLSCWDRKHNEHRWYLLLKNSNTESVHNFNSVSKIVIPGYQKRNLMWQQCKVPGLVNQWKNGIYFAPNYTLPLALKLPSVLVLHDLSFFRYPQHRYFKNALLKVLVRLSVNKAHQCLVDSDFIRQEALALFKDRIKEKLHMVHIGYQDTFLMSPAETAMVNTRQKYGITSDYLLSVGLIFSRRLPVTLLQAFKKFHDEYNHNMMLVLVGENRTHPAIDIKMLINQLQMKDKILWIPRVSEQELKALYHGCRVFMYLSDYEGFGMPILEAMACRKNVVCSDIGVFRELFSGACYFVHNKDPLQIVSKINEAMKTGMSEEALQQCLGRYSWERCADETMRIINEVFLTS